MPATSDSDTLTLPTEHSQKAERTAPLERIALALLAVLYLASATGFALVTPYGETPDESAHLLYVEHLVRLGGLPEIKAGSYSYESVQPPLYYLIGASLVSAGRVITGRSLDQPLAPKLRHNPEHGLEGNVPIVFLNTTNERWPLTVYALRGLSILMGLSVVIFAYMTARLIVPPPALPFVPLLAAGFAALLPQANFIRAGISSENAAALAGAALVWLLVRHLMLAYNSRRVIWIGIAYGLGVLSKTTLVPFLLPVLWVLWVRREGSWRRLGRDLLAVTVVAVLVAGWLYAYKWVIYGEPLAQEATHEMLAHRSPYTLDQLFWFDEPFRSMLWKSFWGSYGWQLIWLPGWLYDAALALTLAMVSGGVYLVARRLFSRQQAHACALLLMAVLVAYATIVLVSTDQLIWQGRELYPALSALCVLCGLGLGGLALGRAAVQVVDLGPRSIKLAAGWGTVSLVAGGLFALNVYSIIWLVLPALNT